MIPIGTMGSITQRVRGVGRAVSRAVSRIVSRAASRIASGAASPTVYSGSLMGRASADTHYRGRGLGLVIIRKRGGFHVTLHHIGHDADNAVGVLDIGIRMKIVLGHNRIENQSKLLIS